MITRTTTALLEGLIEPGNEAVWREFDARYRPVIVGFARRFQLGAEDAADAAQETLIRFLKEYRAGKYDRSRGRLHSWLIGIAKHCIFDLKHGKAKRRELRGLSAIDAIPEDDRLDEIWEAEFQRAILHQGVADLRADSRMEPRTIDAFERVAFDQQTPTCVARELGMTLNDVYLAKHRCLKQLRTIVQRLNETYEAI